MKKLLVLPFLLACFTLIVIGIDLGLIVRAIVENNIGLSTGFLSLTFFLLVYISITLVDWNKSLQPRW